MTQIAFVGNMTGPVEVRYTSSGQPVGNVGVAVNRKRGDKESTYFHKVTLWGEMAEHAAGLGKGTRVVVIGRIESREYETRDGRKGVAWEVTADGFGPDLRWATAQVARVADQDRAGASETPSGGPWGTPTDSGAQAGAWDASKEVPF